MRLVLFDIDGTLLLTGKVGQTSAKAALERFFGAAGRVDEFYPTGRTIEGIFVDTLVDAGFSDEEYRAKREELYADFFAEFRARINRGDHEIKALPGTKELVEGLSAREDIVLGLVTGNHQLTAEVKLTMAGFDISVFKAGAYGHESAHRPHLVPLAQQRAAELTGQRVNGRETVVIGDTTRDIASAKAAGALSIAVATGTNALDVLQAEAPDHIFTDLSDLQAVTTAILQ
ncbi:MAG: HAD family hydrolase [Chloroflexi bacterium]|nr:MAG: HAD family hydrolase [Chloroflexota bacterium]MBL1196469.1 HAD family hydrolase [Chloroflexota bacterium]NOH13764.1 HAD hydrolase-like protein [Chloroflexota bacterium]